LLTPGDRSRPAARHPGGPANDRDQWPDAPGGPARPVARRARWPGAPDDAVVLRGA